MSAVHESDFSTLCRWFPDIGWAGRTAGTPRSPYNADALHGRALGRLPSEQLLGQQLQSLCCVATPHQGDHWQYK